MPTKNDVSKHTQIDDQRNYLNVHSDTLNCKRICYKTLKQICEKTSRLLQVKLHIPMK